MLSELHCYVTRATDDVSILWLKQELGEFLPLLLVSDTVLRREVGTIVDQQQ